MAELGVAASVLTLWDSAVKIVHFAVSVKDAPGAWQKYCDDLRMVAWIHKIIQDKIDKSDESSDLRCLTIDDDGTHYPVVQYMNNRLKVAENEASTLLKRFKLLEKQSATQPSPTRLSSIVRFFERWRRTGKKVAFVLEQDAIEHLMEAIKRAREHLQLVLQLVLLEEVNSGQQESGNCLKSILKEVLESGRLLKELKEKMQHVRIGISIGQDPSSTESPTASLRMARRFVNSTKNKLNLKSPVSVSSRQSHQGYLTQDRNQDTDGNQQHADTNAEVNADTEKTIIGDPSTDPLAPNEDTTEYGLICEWNTGRIYQVPIHSTDYEGAFSPRDHDRRTLRPTLSLQGPETGSPSPPSDLAVVLHNSEDSTSDSSQDSTLGSSADFAIVPYGPEHGTPDSSDERAIAPYYAEHGTPNFSAERAVVPYDLAPVTFQFIRLDELLESWLVPAWELDRYESITDIVETAMVVYAQTARFPDQSREEDDEDAPFSDQSSEDDDEDARFPDQPGEDDDEEAFGLLRAVINEELSDDVRIDDFRLLIEFMRLALKYKDAIGDEPIKQAKVWVADLQPSTSFDNDALAWLWIMWQLDLREEFKKLSATILRQAKIPPSSYEDSHGVRLPDSILEKLDERRSTALLRIRQGIESELNLYRQQYSASLEDGTRCSIENSSLEFGYLKLESDRWLLMTDSRYFRGTSFEDVHDKISHMLNFANREAIQVSPHIVPVYQPISMLSVLVPVLSAGLQTYGLSALHRGNHTRDRLQDLVAELDGEDWGIDLPRQD
ncbi:hypothetical protein B0I35DRAFT_33671 [Stachybotrys elegans]|uniref:Uncharacterized protein n=1 Tax=Stachybotrys elegans TaxID=80388 RepID=A0A8K0WWT5_9HYPO|nr:hypothetical protein B0I35DRAFT_33671 [Stachybotrys elegans]